MLAIRVLALLPLAAAAALRKISDPFAFACSVTARNPLLARLYRSAWAREPEIVDMAGEMGAAEAAFGLIAGDTDEAPRALWETLRASVPAPFGDMPAHAVSANGRTIARRDFVALRLFAILADKDSRTVRREDVNVAVLPARMFHVMDFGRRGTAVTWAQWRDAVVPMVMFSEYSGGHSLLRGPTEVLGFLEALLGSVGHGPDACFDASLRLYRHLFADAQEMTALDAAMVHRLAMHADASMMLDYRAFTNAAGLAATPGVFEAASGGGRFVDALDWSAFWYYTVLTDDAAAMSVERAAQHVPAHVLLAIGGPVGLREWRAFYVFAAMAGGADAALDGAAFVSAGLGTMDDFFEIASGSERVSFREWLSFLRSAEQSL